MIKNARMAPIERATKRSWDEWLTFLDGIDAKNLDHLAIATKVSEELDGVIDNPGWWAQSVTVAYEQYIGRRLPGQRSDGTFEMSVSKATDLGMKELMEKWTSFAAEDKEILDMLNGEARVSGTDKRLTWRVKAKDGSALMVTSEPKQNDKASIIITQMRLHTQDLKDEAKMKWSAIVARFLSSL